ncbi:N-acetylmuramoyl-L-alanine amidase [Parabacteroides sp. OttesenSCG-928-G07]|nr:N-acetylmuramoyl-L-alanine amidase [Parabacteroides sp. OttesenSCG-928-G21]MDL2277972.1 N-acetylmuramoyl-L-alanine amidase [Parabacteroides sp. OttesenSCG-928-G07]
MPKRHPRILAVLILAFIALLSVQAQETATPRAGDGISTFLRRHNRPGADYQKEFIELNKSKLGKNNSLILGTKYTLPSLKESAPVAKKNHEPLFGKKLADYDIVSNELAGAHFYVVSGHGGPDPGAIGKMDNAELHEDEYAYDIALRLARNLLMRGATVHIIIQDKNDGIRDERILKNSKTETCMGAKIPLNQVQRLKQRSEKINELQRKNKPGYSRAIFIHIDSRSKSQQTDVYFYHAGSNAGKKLAETMRNTFAGKYRQHQPNRGFRGTVDQRGLYVLRNSSPVGLYVELGNIQNSFDQRRFVIDDNRQALANWLCEGFITDYKSHK